MLKTLLTVCGLMTSGLASCPDIPSLEVFDVAQVGASMAGAMVELCLCICSKLFYTLTQTKIVVEYVCKCAVTRDANM